MASWLRGGEEEEKAEAIEPYVLLFGSHAGACRGGYTPSRRQRYHDFFF